MISCSVVVEGTMDLWKHTFLTLPRRGEEVHISTDSDAYAYFVKSVVHLPEGFAGDVSEADVLLTLTPARPDA